MAVESPGACSRASCPGQTGFPSFDTHLVDKVLHVRALGLVGLVEPALVLDLLAAHRLEGVVVAAVVGQRLVLELDDVHGHLRHGLCAVGVWIRVLVTVACTIPCPPKARAKA